MTIGDLQEHIKGILKKRPDLKNDILDLYQLCTGEIEDGGSETHEIELCMRDIKELMEGKMSEEYKDHLCGEECDISQCPEEPCHCEYGMTQLMDRAEMRADLARDAISDRMQKGE